jgi:hypothetical protein
MSNTARMPSTPASPINSQIVSSLLTESSLGNRKHDDDHDANGDDHGNPHG